MKKADIGMIGLAVMGENLVLNMASKGFSVAGFDIDGARVEAFREGRAKGKDIRLFRDLPSFVADLDRPRKVMMMIRAGDPVDSVINQLLPLLEAGDVIIDGGNSHFPDTTRRTRLVEGHGMLYVGTGVSGGEEGALNGPSMMPGGSKAAWPLVKPIFQAISAEVEDGSKCCEWIGEDGAGHFVKMVHNGIEYGRIPARGQDPRYRRTEGDGKMDRPGRPRRRRPPHPHFRSRFLPMPFGDEGGTRPRRFRIPEGPVRLPGIEESLH